MAGQGAQRDQRDPLVCIGAGGFSREAAAAAEASGRWEVLGYLDDDPGRHGAVVSGRPVLGALDLAAEGAEHRSAQLLIGVGRPDAYWSRLRIRERLGLPRSRYATVVHPRAVLGPTTSVGAGTALLAGVTTTCDVTIGDHVAVMPNVVLPHDVVVADDATLASNVLLGGNVVVGRGAYVGAGAIVREGVRIGAWSMVGMGSVVTKDVPPGELWMGAPARFARPSPAPRELIEEP